MVQVNKSIAKHHDNSVINIFLVNIRLLLYIHDVVRYEENYRELTYRVNSDPSLSGSSAHRFSSG